MALEQITLEESEEKGIFSKVRDYVKRDYEPELAMAYVGERVRDMTPEQQREVLESAAPEHYELAKQMQGKMGKKGFTLIELLVVISIIGVLSGILLSAVTKVKESARGVQCLNNLKEIGLAIHIYSDNYGQMPPSISGGGLSTPRVYATNQPDGLGWLVQANLLDLRELFCPRANFYTRDNPTLGMSKWGTGIVASSYYYKAMADGVSGSYRLEDSSNRAIVTENNVTYPIRYNHDGADVRVLYSDGHVARIQDPDHNIATIADKKLKWEWIDSK
jgi:prepilin-type N-terminal cleavage/methylation domain-containing protein